MKELKAKKTDPKKYLKINLKDTSVGFDRPIVMVNGDDKAVTGTLFLDKFAIFNGNYMQFNHSEYIYDLVTNFDITREYYKKRKNADSRNLCPERGSLFPGEGDGSFGGTPGKRKCGDFLRRRRSHAERKCGDYAQKQPCGMAVCKA